MEELAKKIREEMGKICINYIFLKKTDVIEKAIPLTGDIQTFLGYFLQGNVFDMKEEEYAVLSAYAAGVAADYVEAITQRDAVLMIDTLDYGLRELLDIYMPQGEEVTDGGNI